jgi:hypothetical protein
MQVHQEITSFLEVLDISLTWRRLFARYRQL